MKDAHLTISRRALLRHIFFASGTAAMTPLLQACGSTNGPRGETNAPPANLGELSIPSGRLADIPQLGPANSEGIAVPEGFSVRVVARHGTPPAAASDYPWHPAPDGGAVYMRDNGGWIYTSNSEVPAPGGGGCGALVFDPPPTPDGDAPIVDAYSILSGTRMNCAGGKTPWSTWLSCEEFDDSAANAGPGSAGMAHECDPFGMVGAVPKPALGRFAHEAAAVDLRNITVYETEDAGDGRFYRWVAERSDFSSSDQRLALENGTLQVMNIEGFEDGGYPATEDVRLLRRVTWKDVVNPDMGQAGVRAGMTNPPGTRFDGGEGLWFFELPPALRTVPPAGTTETRGLVFWSTKGDNRVWALDIENQLVELIFDNEQIDPDFADVDNVTVSPAGDILVAEDAPAAVDRPIRIMVVVPNKPARVLVEVLQPGSELTGPAFTPDGSRLYFSSQRGPNQPGTNNAGTGVTYELLIPPEFRST